MSKKITNYHPGNKTDRRRRHIKMAIQKSDFDTVFIHPQNFYKRIDGYKKDRIKSDLFWMVDNRHKYYTEIMDSEDIPLELDKLEKKRKVKLASQRK